MVTLRIYRSRIVFIQENHRKYIESYRKIVQKNVSAGISFDRKQIAEWKKSVQLNFYVQIEGVVTVPFDLTFHFSAENNISSDDNTFFVIFEIRLSRKCYPPP